MIVRATQDLPPNTEIVSWYQTPFADNDEERRERMRQHWGFTCDCIMCTDHQAAKRSVLSKRKSLYAEGMAQFRSRWDVNTTKVESTLTKPADTYTHSTTVVSRLRIFDIQSILTKVYSDTDKPTKTITSALCALQSLCYVVDGGTSSPDKSLVAKKWSLMMDGFLNCWVMLARAYRVVGDFGLEKRAWEYAKVTYKICVGKDETFEETVEMVV